MNSLYDLLTRVQQGQCPVADAVESLKHWPAENLDYACLDHQRSVRTGLPEVVFGENKTASQIIGILERLLAGPTVALATRVSPEKAAVVQGALPGVHYEAEARMLVGNEPAAAAAGSRGTVLVVSAGTSDIPVAQEALVTARCLGNRVEKLYDVGVAGIHRLLCRRSLLEEAAVLIVVAGMEGALPSVVGGLVSRPVIAVPTSVGYGTGFGGLAALLGMLNSCAPGVSVVNIDNGFGAGCVAAAINRV